MKNERRRTQDFNLLSAYLDDVLNRAQRIKLEKRLKREPELRQKLENLRRTKIILGNLPRLHAPRNFTLTPDMVTVRRAKKQPMFTTLRLASALAAILLVVMFGAEFLLKQGMFSNQMLSEAPMLESAKTADMTPEPLIQWQESGGYGGGGVEAGVEGMGGDFVAMEQPAGEIDSAPVEEEMVEEAMPEEVMPEEAVEAELAPAPAAEPGMMESDAQEAEGKDLILGINPEQGGEILDRSEPARQPDVPAFDWHVLLRWAQIILAAIAVSGGIIYLILRKKRFS